MLAVAAAAIPLALFAVVGSRRDRFDRLSDYHKSRIAGTVYFGTYGRKYAYLDSLIRDNPNHIRTYERATSRQRLRDLWHLDLCNKYYAAAQRPWYPVAADPPPPD